jgi:hypothetical protein
MNKKRPLEIKEFQYKIIDSLDIKKDRKYLNSRCFRQNGKLPYRVTGEIGTGNICIENRGSNNVLRSCTGIMELTSDRVDLATKVPTHIIYMLSYLRSDELFVDPYKSIKMEEGVNFFDAVARQFLNEIEKIYEIGILEKFVLKHDNRDYLIGILNIEGQIRNDINSVLKFSCNHDGDLDSNNLENKIILRAIHDLIPMIMYNEDVRQGLKNYENIIRNSVESSDIFPEDCDRVVFDSDNNYYRKAIELAKMIFRNRYIRSTREGRSLAFNFVTYPSTVFEHFLVQMFDNVIRDDFEDIFEDIGQKVRFHGMVIGNKSKIPDRTLRLKGTRLFPFPLDIKYKVDDHSADYDQISGYSTIIPGAIACFLVYPVTKEFKEQKKGIYIVKDKDIRKDGTKINPEKKDRRKLYVCVIDQYIKDDLSYKEFIKGIKYQIRGMIIEILQETINYYIDIDMKLDTDKKLNKGDQKIIHDILLTLCRDSQL